MTRFAWCWRMCERLGNDHQVRSHVRRCSREKSTMRTSLSPKTHRPGPLGLRGFKLLQIKLAITKALAGVLVPIDPVKTGLTQGSTS